jgi:hypothetical protein
VNISSCRFWAGPLKLTFCDLGMLPLSNAVVKPVEAQHSEIFYPQHAFRL